jgi:demethylmenaquinone methyltransferase/2-methoxy-6-polyprenyl-1,4-benzoquinol methylase
MFESIARHYDLANTVLSLGLHHRWKRTLVGALHIGPGDLILDAGTGTGDLAHLAASRGAQVIGLDLSPAMLEIAAGRSARLTRLRPQSAAARQLDLLQGDISHLPLHDGTVTAVMSAFVLRHLRDLVQAFGELRRVLAPEGRIALLEFSQPRRWIRPLYDAYSFRVIPPLGGWLTGDRRAYEFLVRSIRGFPAPAHVARALRDVGFVSVRWRPLTGGIATLYTGQVTSSVPYANTSFPSTVRRVDPVADVRLQG